MAEAILRNIPLNQIRENPVALRQVDRSSEEYLGIVDSVRRNGILNPILVRELKAENGEILYGLIDGLHRFSAAQDAGLAEIPANVRNMEDAATLEAQLIANVHKVETRPVEYANQLKKILAQNPLLTSSELATRLAKSPAWLNDRLGLAELPKDIASLVDEGKICLSNAYALAKLAKTDEQEAKTFVDRAMTMSPQEFVPTATNRIKQIRDLRRQGRDQGPKEFVAVAHLRKVLELKNEVENPTVGPVLVRDLKIKDAKEAFSMGVKWALHLDPVSVNAAKIKEEERKKAADIEKEARKKERDAKKHAEAIKTGAAIV